MINRDTNGDEKLSFQKDIIEDNQAAEEIIENTTLEIEPNIDTTNLDEDVPDTIKEQKNTDA
jgi:hypothetical protein